MSRINLDDYISITRALSDPHRVRALLALRNGELCVCQLIDLFGLAPSTVSKHMSVLKQAGLVSSRKDSRWVYYNLTGETNRNDATGEFIKITLDLLNQDKQVESDDIKLSELLSRGLDDLCKQSVTKGETGKS